MRRRPVDRVRYYRGIRMVPYDLIKELSIAMGALLVVVLVLSATLSSPDVPPVTIQSWAAADPVDFVTTATNELAGTTTVSNYGPPYNSGTGSIQSWGFLHFQEWGGTHVPVNPPNDFVLQPLQQSASHDSDLSSALDQFNKATTDQQTNWLANYTMALGSATVNGAAVQVVSGDYGPVTVLMDRMLKLGQSGALDGLLLTSGHFYQTDFTRPLLFMNDGTYFSSLAQQQMLLANQWGVMNETGRYPGQAWLWLYTMWYQIPPYNTASNADLLVVLTMVALSLLLLLVPFIPGLRDLPRWIPIHRLIWRRYYAEKRQKS